MRSLFSAFLAVGIIVAFTSPADAQKRPAYVPVQTKPSDLELVDVGIVKEVLKSNAVQLDNKSVFVLENIRTPIHYERHARTFLESLVKGKQVGIYVNPTRPDEGRTDPAGNEMAHLVLEDGTWVQAALVAKGLSWVDSGEHNRDLTEPLYKHEIAARAGKQGFWVSPEYAVKNIHTIGGNTGTFQIFEGRVDKVGQKAEYDYIHFIIPSQTRAMTLVFDRQNYKIFPSLRADPTRGGFTPYDLANVQIRVRGWVELLYGVPMMRITHPEVMEFPNGRPTVK